ncbi:MAG: CapA family protein [Clostridiales bacterium]|nr:CapA family protein [Clostridiales bacterium]
MIKAHIFLIICALTMLITSTGCGSRAQTGEPIDSVSVSEENADGVSEIEHSVDGTVDDAGTSGTDGVDNAVCPEISIVMVGDILLHTPVAESGVQEDGSYNFDAVFANVKEEVAAADLAIVNQEVIIGGEELGVSGYPCFNAPYELGDALVDAGFDIVLHATNHALDKGSKGINNCISFWKNNYPQIAVLGINESEEEQENIYVYEKDGVKIAILNYTYGTNGIPLPEDMPYAVNMLEKEKVAEDIGKAKEAADFIIVCPHWGTEYRLTPSAEQEQWTDFFLENGVDLVIGTHPHVIEPIEWVGDDNGNEMLVYYSLGNFVNWTSGRGEGVANRMVGGMAQITVTRNEDGEVCILDYGVEPLVCHLREGANGVTTYFLSDYTQQMAEENMITAQDAEFSAEYCESLCREVWSGISLKSNE